MVRYGAVATSAAWPLCSSPLRHNQCGHPTIIVHSLLKHRVPFPRISSKREISVSRSASKETRCSSGADSQRHILPQKKMIHQIHHTVNRSSKWVVCSIVIAVVLWKRDDEVLWAIAGAILNAANSKLLKKIFNQQRPATALGLKVDSGMPSSHAQSLGYLSLYSAIGLVIWQGFHFVAAGCAFIAFITGVYLAWLRASQGLHTTIQVVAGLLFGYGMAITWIGLWYYFVTKAIALFPVLHYLLVSFFGICATCFLAFGISRWRFGDA